MIFVYFYLNGKFKSNSSKIYYRRREKTNVLWFSRWKVLLEYYYRNIEIYRNENSELQSHHKLNDLNKFLNYDTYELARDTTYIGKTYKIAIINYIYKWYSNSK